MKNERLINGMQIRIYKKW